MCMIIVIISNLSFGRFSMPTYIRYVSGIPFACEKLSPLISWTRVPQEFKFNTRCVCRNSAMYGHPISLPVAVATTRKQSPHGPLGRSELRCLSPPPTPLFPKPSQHLLPVLPLSLSVPAVDPFHSSWSFSSLSPPPFEDDVRGKGRQEKKEDEKHSFKAPYYGEYVQGSARYVDQGTQYVTTWHNMLKVRYRRTTMEILI